ncbi:MAG: hypothetical protein ABIO65_06925 [Nitrospiria bacterium]
MDQPHDIRQAIVDAKKQVAERRAAVPETRQDAALRGLRKTLRRLQRRRRSQTAQQTLLQAKMTKKTAGAAAKAG